MADLSPAISFQGRAAAGHGLNPADLDQEMQRMWQGLADLSRINGRLGSELATIARGGGAVAMPDIPQPLTRDQVVAIVEEVLGRRPTSPQPAPSVDLRPLESRLQALEQSQTPAPSPSAAAPSVDLAPVLDRLARIENGIISTRLFVYRAIVADRRLREALAALEDAGDLTASATVPGTAESGSKYPVLVAENPGGSSDKIREYAWRVFASQILWARSGATLPTATPEQLETAIATYFQGGA